MSSEVTYVEIFSNIAFGVSLLVNVFFIYVVYSKTRRDIGSYKYLMIWFATVNILYSFTEFINKPTIFVFGHSYIAYSKGYITEYQNEGFLCLCFFFAMYGMNTAVLSLQFIYRYLFVCRQNLAFLIEEKRYILMWIMAVFAWGATYGLITYYCFAPSEEYYSYARNFILRDLGLSVEEMTFYCVFVYERTNGQLIIHWKGTVGIIVNALMMVFTFALMVYCGMMILCTLRKVAMCAKTKALQRQLMRALIFQAAMPFLLSYTPRFILFGCVFAGYSEISRRKPHTLLRVLMSSVITYVEIFSNIAFGGSLLVNTFFIYIVYSKTKRDIGSYKYLMIWFAVINILYSFAEFISKPTIFIYGHSYIAYSKGYMTDYQQQGFLCLCFFIAMYGMNTAVLSLQFIYRYLFVCRSNLAFLIEEKRYIFMWIMSVLAWGTTYGLITYVCFPPTREYYRFARNYIRSELELSVEEMTFFCVFVYEYRDGRSIIYWKSTIGIISIAMLMVATFALMVFCGVKILCTLRKVAMCEKTKALQKQLMRALIFQATIPFLLSYTPRFILFGYLFAGYSGIRHARMFRSLLLLSLVSAYMVDARVRRQAEDEQSDLTLSDWNPTIRDRFESCNSIATFAPTPEQYCKAFIMCCSMQFDPNNGDKCQTNEQRCIPLEEGGTDAVCIQRNCTELVTTTTTTTTTPELMVIQEPANSADGISIAVVSATLSSLCLLLQ